MRKPVTHRHCVSVVVYRRAEKGYELLLVHKPRKRDDWQIAQGGIEEGETVEQAAMRELEEETGIKLAQSPTISQYDYQYDYPRRFVKRERPKYEGQHLAFVTAEVPYHTEVTVDHRELDTYKWIRPRKLKKYLKRRKYRRAVQKAFFSALESG